MKHSPKKFVRNGLVVAALAVVILVMQAVVLPQTVRHLILSKLADIGLSGASLEVRSCSWRRATLANLSLGEDRCACIGALTVHYSLGLLVRGELKKVQVVGGQLLLRIRDGKVELGELAQIRLKGGKDNAEPPFESIELNTCIVSINWRGKTICIPCEGSILNAGSGRIVYDLRLHFQGIPLQISGTLDTHGESIAFSLDEQNMDVRTMLSVLPIGEYDLPARFAGRINLKVQGEISTSDGSAVLSLALSEGGFKTALADLEVDAEDVSCKLKVELGDEYRLKNVNGNLSAEEMRVGTVRAHDFHTNLEKTADTLVLHGRAQGEKWLLKGFSAALPETWRRKDGGTHVTDVSWELEGHVPDAIAAELSQRGIEIAKIGSASITGRLSADISKLPDFEVDDLQIELAPGNLEIPCANVTLRDLSGILRFRGNYRKGTGISYLLADSGMQFESATIGSLSVGKTNLAFPKGQGHNTAELTFSDTGTDAHIKLTATAGDTSVLAAKDHLKVDVGAARLVADVNLSAESNTVRSMLEVESIRCGPGRRGLWLDIQKAVLDTVLEGGNAVEPTVSSELAFDEITVLNENSDTVLSLDKGVLHPISGSFGLRQRKGEFAGRWPVQKDAVLKVSGDLDFAGGKPSGLLTVTCDGFRVDEEHGAGKALADATSIAVSGDFTLRGKLGLQRGRFVPRLEIAVTDAAFSSTHYQAEAEGVTGSMTFTGFSPLSTPGNQYLEVQSLRLAKVDLRDGYVAFRLEDDPAAVFIERTGWGWLGGRIYNHAMRIGSNEETISFRVFAEGLDLGDLVGFAFGENATGEGKLYGMIPVSISASNLADFSLGEGFLYASTPEGWWRLQGKTSESPALKALEQQLEQVSATHEPTTDRKQLLGELLNFEYSKFKLDFLKEGDGGLTARITAQGQSRNRQIPVEFEGIVLDIPNFDKTLRNVVIARKAIGHSLTNPAENTRD